MPTSGVFLSICFLYMSDNRMWSHQYSLQTASLFIVVVVVVVIMLTQIVVEILLQCLNMCLFLSVMISHGICR